MGCLEAKAARRGQHFSQHRGFTFLSHFGDATEKRRALLKSLEISSASAGNRLLSKAIVQSAENISSGETLARPLAACGLIPPPVMAMISVAEESNNLDNVLVKIADRLDSKIERQLAVMVRLVEPVMLVLIGGMVLFILVALLLPVFDMSTAVG